MTNEFPRRVAVIVRPARKVSQCWVRLMTNKLSRRVAVIWGQARKVSQYGVFCQSK